MTIKEIQIKDYNYPLPDERIAKYPLKQRDQSKLLVYRKGTIEECSFAQLPLQLPKGALMVFNNTRVVRARLHFHKQTGALIEIFILEPKHPEEYQENFVQRKNVEWHCLVGNLKKWKGETLQQSLDIQNTTITLKADLLPHQGTNEAVRFSWDGNFTWAEVLEAAGELPIPPYLNRKTEESDLKTYQTVYSRIKGSVAAPTAGLHFTSEVLNNLDSMGIERDEVTLHVGAGTFKPVKSEHIGDHEMHTEHIAVQRHTIERLIAHDGNAIAVGTTSVRTLESLFYMGYKAQKLMETGQDKGDGIELHINQWDPYNTDIQQTDPMPYLQKLLTYMIKHHIETLHSSTQIIIAPGYRFHIVRMMITNFHQPQSTLLLLVSAFVNGNWREIYDYALAHNFRFLSYGDSSLLIP